MTVDIQARFAEVVSGSVDPYPFYAQARRTAPIFWSDSIDAWVAVRRSDVAMVLEDGERFRPLPFGPGSSAVHGRVILHMEGAEHRFHAGLLGKWIRSRRRMQGELRALTEQVTSRILAAIPFNQPVDLHEVLNTGVPMLVTATFMGIPDVAEFRDWYSAIGQASVSNVGGDPEVELRGSQARDALAAYVQPAIDRRRTEPSNDLLSDLCQAEFEGEPLSDELIASTCSLLLAAGVETTSRALSNLQLVLFQRRNLWEELQADRSLVVPACAEILRTAPPAHGLVRHAIVDTELAGVPIRKGDRLMVLIGSANRDETVFDNADNFDLHRFGESAFRQFTPKSDILPFGAGSHHCTGSLLAQMEMEVVMNQLLDGVAWADFVDGVPVETGYVLRAPSSMPVRLSPA